MIEIKPKRERRRAIIGNALPKHGGPVPGSIEEKLRTLRIERRMTQLDLCNAAKVSLSVITQYETGGRRIGYKATMKVVEGLSAKRPLPTSVREWIVDQAFFRTRHSGLVQSTMPLGLQGPSPCTAEPSCPKCMDAAGVYRRVALTEGGEG